MCDRVSLGLLPGNDELKHRLDFGLGEFVEQAMDLIAGRHDLKGNAPGTRRRLNGVNPLQVVQPLVDLSKLFENLILFALRRLLL